MRTNKEQQDQVVHPQENIERTLKKQREWEYKKEPWENYKRLTRDQRMSVDLDKHYSVTQKCIRKDLPLLHSTVIQ